MDRIALTKETFKKLFGGNALSGEGADPELMDILQKFIFGEVFHTGNLTDRQRELITIVTLATLQTLPQLKAHTGAALNIGVTPLEIREAVYQCGPFIGFPKTLNTVSTINEVFKERNISLPLENQSAVSEENRFVKGKEIQDLLFEDEDGAKHLPVNFNVPRFVTEMAFGDFYTRSGLDVKTRELLTFCVLVALGAESQLKAHALANIKGGNSKETLISAMLQCIGYIGFPHALNAINVIEKL